MWEHHAWFEESSCTPRQEEPRTPANDGVPVEISPLREEGFHQQSEEVQPLDEQPEVVGHDTVVKKHHHCFAFHLQRMERNKIISALLWPHRKKKTPVVSGVSGA